MAVSKTMVQKAKQEEVAAPVPKKEPETPTKPALVPNHQIPPSAGDIKSDDIKTDLKSLRPLASKTNHVLKDPQKAMIMLNKLSKEDEELMQRSIKKFNEAKPDRMKDLGPVRRRHMDNGASSDSESDGEGGPKKLKSKFAVLFHMQRGIKM